MNDVIIDSPSVMNEQKSEKLNEEMNDICICLTYILGSNRTTRTLCFKYQHTTSAHMKATQRPYFRVFASPRLSIGDVPAGRVMLPEGVAETSVAMSAECRQFYLIMPKLGKTSTSFNKLTHSYL